jgi:DNA transformation protein and related proteins
VSGQEFADHLLDLLGPLGPVSARRMFGGVGLFYGSTMFALIASEELYLKADERNRPDFEAEGEGPFAYETSGGRRAIMSYWRAPERMLDEPDELRAWARKSVDAALAAAKSKPKRAGRRRSPSGAVAGSAPRRGRGGGR